jgi:hypothetical protein
VTRSRLLRRRLPAVFVAAVLVLTACRAPGSSWTDLAMPRPVPQGSTPNYFTRAAAPACAPSGFCALLGAVEKDGTDESYAMSWQDGRWAPMPATDVDETTSVSCASSTTCAAGRRDVVATYDGTAWTAVPGSVLFPGATAGGAIVVSCGAPDRCVALRGDRAAAWDGSVWTPSTGSLSEASTVACVGPSFCLAAGDRSGRAFRWNGSTWAETVRIPQPGDGVGIAAITCWAVDGCMIAGSRAELNPGGAPGDVIVSRPNSVRWNGTQFDTVITPVGIRSLSCVTSNRCVAILEDGPPQLLLLTAWEPLPLPPMGRGWATLSGVSCWDHTCVAAGSGTGAGPATVAVAYKYTFPAR